MNDLKRFLDFLRRGPLMKGKITTDGNCFFHALEYALGNCQLPDKKHRYLNRDRLAAVDALRSIYEPESERLHQLNWLSDAQRSEMIDLDRKLAELVQLEDTTGRDYEFSTEDIIYITAFLKGKILFILECEPIPDRNEVQYGFTLIAPDGIDLTEENIVILTRTGRNHYDTLNYGQINGRDNGRIFPDSFVDTLRRNIPDLPSIHTLDRVTVMNGNVDIFFEGPTVFEEPDAAERELQSIFNDAEMSQENQNRFLAEQFHLAEQFQEKRLHAKEPKQTIRIKNKTHIEPFKDTIRIQRKTRIEPFKDTIRIHNQQIQNNLAFAKKIQEQSLPISRTHPRRTLSLNKGPSGLNRYSRSLPSRSKPRSPRTRRGYFNFTWLWKPKTRKKK